MQIYRAVITNNKDPEFQNRYQVRIFGLVDGNTSGFESTADADLPWAECMGSTAFGLIGKVGVSSVMHQGTWVYVILQDNDPNQPIILGTVTGTAKKDQDGFKDPDGKFPLEEGPDMNVSGDKYTFNQTIKTQSGHLIEIDDSEGDERIHVYHMKGTYLLIDKDGNIFVNGVKNAQFDIAENVTWNIGKNSTINIGENSAINIQGTLTETIKGRTTFDTPNTHFTGNVNIDKISTAQGDHVSAGISGKGHTHTAPHGETSGPH